MYIGVFLLCQQTHILEREDSLGALFNIAANTLRNELADEALEVGRRYLTLDDRHHLLADEADLG